MRKYRVTFRDREIPKSEPGITVMEAESSDRLRDELETRAPHLTILNVEDLMYVHDHEIATYIQHVTFTDRIVDQPLRCEQIRERLACSRHLARLLGTDAQASLVRCLWHFDNRRDPAHGKPWAIDGLDSCPFSFLFNGAGMYGGVIFHEASKTWSTHT